jgi:hypothetical protein
MWISQASANDDRANRQLAAQPDQLVGFGEQLLRDGIVPDVGLAAWKKRGRFARKIRAPYFR